jgi:hypothetical protein
MREARRWPSVERAKRRRIERTAGRTPLAQRT